VKTLNRDRRSYSFKTVLVAQRASGFNLAIELKNIILRRVSIFEFSHSQGQEQNFFGQKRNVRSTPDSRHPTWPLPCRLRATSRHWRASQFNCRGEAHGMERVAA
jgi:hypothetical protein